MKYKILVISLFIIFLTNIAFAEFVGVDSDSLSISINSPIDKQILSDYNISRNEIIINKTNKLSIIAGEDIITKYNFYNKLNDKLTIKYTIDFKKEIKKNNLEIIVLKKGDCDYKYKQEVLKINQDSVCKIKDFVLENNSYDFYLELLPKDNYFYFLIKTTPFIASGNYNVSSQVLIDNKKNLEYINNRNYLRKKTNQDENKENNNSYINLSDDIDTNEPNYITESIDYQELENKISKKINELTNTNTDKNIDSNQNIDENQLKKDKDDSLLTGFFSLNNSKSYFYVLGFLIIMLLGYLYYKKNKKIEGL